MVFLYFVIAAFDVIVVAFIIIRFSAAIFFYGKKKLPTAI